MAGTKTQAGDERRPRGRRCVVKRSPIHGRGVFAATRLRPGTQIIEYTGERVTQDEIDRRYGVASEDGHTMLFALDDGMTIDATRRGSIARYINHSCEGNCRSVSEGNRIFIEAAKNIQPGTELTYDYQLLVSGRVTRAEREAYACHCGVKRCRGMLLQEAKKPKRKRK